MNWGSICRICSCPAEYEVFAIIPTYLHGSSNEFLNWQKPINSLLEECTGLKVSPDDGLPHSICALCISYLKHAVNFREQTINNAMSLKAVGILRQHTQKKAQQENHRDKEAILITAQDLTYADGHQTDANLLLNNYHQQDKRQDKVRKQLLNNNIPTPQNIEQQMRYLNLLFDKDPNAGQRHKQRTPAASGLVYEIPLTGSGGDVYPEEEFQTATSSDDNENRGAGGAASQKHNIFSYKEKNFEEDDIMDMDELRSAVTINIPESCKERKCRACFRRFMFEESYTEHVDTCIEYKFLTYIEEINRLLDIRRSKAVSPHEFIRRMIFCLRKTCEWLKLNCADMLLPDLLHNGDSASKQQRAESDAKSSATSSGEPKEKPNEKLAAKLFDMRNKRNKLTDFMRESKATESVLLAATTKENDLNLDDAATINNLFMTPKPIRSPSTTPISISNNILYEIERSQSRNSNHQANSDLSTNSLLKKPIAVLATNGGGTAAQQNDAAERLTFLEKLKQAACQTPPATTACKKLLPATPQINVRKDLLIQPTPLKDASSPMPLNLSFSARCNPCNILFETLASLEVHNAMRHNNNMAAANNNKQQQQQPSMSAVDTAADEERKRIIALFEEDDSANEA